MAEGGDRCHHRLLIREVVDLAEPTPALGHGAGDDEHRDRVVVRLGDGGHRVRQAGPADQHANAGVPGDPGPGVRHERRTLLVTRRDVADGRMRQAAVELERVDAGDPEDGRRAKLLQEADGRLSTRWHYHTSRCRIANAGPYHRSVTARRAPEKGPQPLPVRRRSRLRLRSAGPAGRRRARGRRAHPPRRQRIAAGAVPGRGRRARGAPGRAAPLPAPRRGADRAARRRPRHRAVAHRAGQRRRRADRPAVVRLPRAGRGDRHGLALVPDLRDRRAEGGGDRPPRAAAGRRGRSRRAGRADRPAHPHRLAVHAEQPDGRVAGAPAAQPLPRRRARAGARGDRRGLLRVRGRPGPRRRGSRARRPSRQRRRPADLLEDLRARGAAGRLVRRAGRDRARARPRPPLLRRLRAGRTSLHSRASTTTRSWSAAAPRTPPSALGSRAAWVRSGYGHCRRAPTSSPRGWTMPPRSPAGCSSAASRCGRSTASASRVWSGSPSAGRRRRTRCSPRSPRSTARPPERRRRAPARPARRRSPRPRPSAPRRPPSPCRRSDSAGPRR